MFNLTKKIKLAPAWEKRYKILRVFVFLFFAAGISWIGYSILFPARHFNFSLAHLNSSKNTLAGFQKSENKLIFNTIAVGDFSKAKITVTSKKSAPSLENSKVFARKSYRAFFYPIGKDISNPSDYSINSLVSLGKSVFIVGQGKKFPIDNPLTFEEAGFKWENVEPANEKDLSQYEKQGLFNIHDAHPNGTVLWSKESGKYFFIQNEKKREIKGEALAKPDLRKKAVPAEEKGLKMKEECLLKKNLFLANRYSCTIPVGKLNFLLGKDYRFEIDTEPGAEISKIDVTLRKTADWKNFITSLSEIKNKVFLKYGIQQKNE